MRPKPTQPRSLLICESCRRGGIELIEPALDGRPQFRCTRCKVSFTSGKDGEPYMGALRSRGLAPSPMRKESTS